ncbi:MAG: peptide ABC transporter substrate-binding protein [Verrucomicrobia bacterium]|nr:peptide ABC transporter substrate-binding protein [Verrucomicrobiota bacterium]
MSRHILAITALLVGLISAGCARRETAVAAGNRTLTLHVGTGGEPSELDPHLINAAPDYQIVYAFFEGLLRGDPNTLEPRPGVAERWSVSPDGLVYTFHLRANARWSNGDPLTAEDFLFSFRRALSPALGSQYTLLFNPVRGAAAFAAGKLTDFAQVGFAAPDPRTLVVTLARPTPYFLALVTDNAIWFPVHCATIEKHGRFDQRGTGWTRPGRFVGNGPFALKEWRPNQIIVAEKSPTYWDAAAVRLRAVHFHPIENRDTEERAFRAGQLHVTRVVPIARVAAYRAQNPRALLIAPQLESQFINVNTARPPLNDARVRRALALALDRRRYAERVMAGTQAPAFNLVPDGTPGYTPIAKIAEDDAAARALLAEAGFPRGAGFTKLTLGRPAGGTTELAQAVQESWRTKLGIEVAIEESESRTHWSNLQLTQYDLSIGGWLADYPDASTFLDLFVSGGGWNFTGWADARFDALIAAASGELDPARRLDLLQQAEARLLEAMPVIPLAFPRLLILVQPSVRDWPKNVLHHPDYKATWLAPE